MNWISLPVFLVGYGMFFYSYSADRSYITYYDGNRKYRGTGVPEDRGGLIAIETYASIIASNRQGLRLSVKKQLD